jgi:hypothetical protein
MDYTCYGYVILSPCPEFGGKEFIQNFGAGTMSTGNEMGDNIKLDLAKVGAQSV